MRSDGTRVTDTDPLHAIMPYIMNRRCDSTVMVTLNISLEPIRSYIRSNRREDHPVSHMAVIVTAILRTVHEYPHFNRFLVNQKMYQHNDFSIAMMVLRSGEDDASMSKLFFDWDDDIFEVHRKIEEYIGANRSGGETNATDTVVNFLLSLPGAARIGIGVIKLLDHFGLMPKSLINASPFHASMAISNLASLNTPRIYHHLYEFGTISMFLIIGAEQFVPLRNRSGFEMERCIPLTFTFDERICSGAYFARGFARLRFYLEQPHLLEKASDSGTKTTGRTLDSF